MRDPIASGLSARTSCCSEKLCRAMSVYTTPSTSYGHVHTSGYLPGSSLRRFTLCVVCFTDEDLHTRSASSGRSTSATLIIGTCCDFMRRLWKHDTVQCITHIPLQQSPSMTPSKIPLDDNRQRMPMLGDAAVASPVPPPCFVLFLCYLWLAFVCVGCPLTHLLS